MSIWVLEPYLVSVGASLLSLGLFSLFKEPKCGGVILALQSYSAIHLDVDNLGVVRHVGRLLDCRHGPTLLSLSMMVISSC